MLGLRILSAVVMAPPALLAVWLGGPAFMVLVAVAAAVMAWEWDTICNRRFGTSGMLLASSGVAAAFLAADWPSTAAAVVLAAAAGAFIAGTGPLKVRLWQAAGAVYIGFPAASLVWLREGPSGRETIFWLFLIVWATDIGAYAAGRLIGGPKLAPRISPNKTWAGLGGGVASAALVGAAAAFLLGLPGEAALIAFSGLLAVVAQGGDLFESWVKRRFGVKDSSGIIPGHGGVLDRVDGLLAAAPVVAAVSLAFGGALSWR